MEKYKLYGLKIVDLRNVEIVNLDFDGKNLIEISGKNGSGKTTIIDSIFIALNGTKYLGKTKNGWRVIKNGKDRAEIEVIIGNENRKIEIRRSITKIDRGNEIDTGGTITIKDSENRSIGQNFLDSLLSKFTVNPLGFAYMDPKEQIKIIKELGGIDTSEIENKYKNTYSERTEVNREIKRLEGVVKTNQGCEQVDEVITADLLKERKEASNHYEKIKGISESIDNINELIDDDKKRIDEIDEEILKLQEERKQKDLNIQNKIISINKLMSEHDELLDVKLRSIEEIDKDISEADTKNEQYRTYKSYIENLDLLNKEKIKSKNLTDELDQLNKDKVDLIANSKLPFKNISFDDEVGILINEIPFSQMSTAEQLKISTRVGIELSPMKIIYIKEGAMLDEESFNIISDMAMKHDYQILVETVGDGYTDNSIKMHEGRVISESTNSELEENE